MALLPFQVRWACLPVPRTGCATHNNASLHGRKQSENTIQHTSYCARERWDPGAGSVPVWMQVSFPSPAAPAALSPLQLLGQARQHRSTRAAQREVTEMMSGGSVCTSHRGVQVLGSSSTLILFTPARLNSHIQCSPWRHSDMFCLNEGTAPSESVFLWYSSPSVW